MARTRYLKPEFFMDITLAELSVETRYLYAGLWPHMDRNGICEGSPRLIKAWVFPYDDQHSATTVVQQLQHLIALERLQVADFDGKRFLRCKKFATHQWFHKDERPIFNIPEENWRHTWDALEHTSVLLEHNHTSQSGIVTVTVTGTGTGTGTSKTLAALVKAGKPPSEKSSSEVFQIRDAFCLLYAEMYNNVAYEWDHARDGRQAKLLLTQVPLEKILGELDAYFGWKDPKVIEEGHTFSHGYQSFIKTRRRLQADMAAPERHQAAAIIRQEKYHEGKEAYVRRFEK